MADDDIKKLNPEDRVKKLKEIADKKKKEIEEAQKEIREAEGEMSEKRKEKEKVPIPEVAKEEVDGLSETAQAILKEQRGISKKSAAEEKKSDEEKSSKGQKNDSKELSLEDTVAQEKVSRFAANVDYSQQLSQKPMANLYQEMTTIYKAVEDKGYINPAEQQRVQYLTSAVEKKLEAVEAGNYSLNEEVARAALLTQQLGGSLSSMYKDNRKTGKGNEWYKSG